MSRIRRSRITALLWIIAGCLLILGSFSQAIHWHLIKRSTTTHGMRSPDYLREIRGRILEAGSDLEALTNAAEMVHGELVRDVVALHDSMEAVVMLWVALAGAGGGIFYLGYKLFLLVPLASQAASPTTGAEALTRNRQAPPD
jgi:hypothetical protein